MSAVLDDVETLRRAGLLMGSLNGDDPVWAGMAAVLAAFARVAAVEYGNWLSRDDAVARLDELVGYPEALATARAYLGIAEEMDDAAAELELATVGEPVHKVTGVLGRVQSVCGQAGYNLAEGWEYVTCRDCRRMRPR